MANEELFRFPDASHRVAIVGQTGSGKTTFGVWLLSHTPIEERPWVVVDYKREILFRQLGKHSFRSILTPKSPAPKKPGLHIIQPFESDDAAMDDFFWRIWERGNTGLYIDEALMPPAGRGSAIRAILTQGRSKKIPLIALSQRPVEVDRYYFSEAQFFSIFYLLDRDDRITMKRFTPIDPDWELPAYHSYWFDAQKRLTLPIKPIETDGSVLQRLRDRAPRRLWFDL